MAKSATFLGRVEFVPAAPKVTKQGQGAHSRPTKNGKKKLRGQGKA